MSSKLGKVSRLDLKSVKVRWSVQNRYLSQHARGGEGSFLARHPCRVDDKATGLILSVWWLLSLIPTFIPGRTPQFESDSFVKILDAGHMFHAALEQLRRRRGRRHVYLMYRGYSRIRTPAVELVSSSLVRKDTSSEPSLDTLSLWPDVIRSINSLLRDQQMPPATYGVTSGSL